MSDAVPGELVEAAVQALESYAGCEPERATALVDAVQEAVAGEAVEVIAGKTQAFGSAVDRRVAILDRVVRALSSTERMPTDYEVGTIFQITPTQGRNVLRTYQARFAESYMSHLQGRVNAIKAKVQTHDEVKVYVFDYDDPDVLEFAAEQLRRRGLVRSVLVDRTQLDLVVNQDETDRLGKDAAEILNPA